MIVGSAGNSSKKNSFELPIIALARVVATCEISLLHLVYVLMLCLKKGEKKTEFFFFKLIKSVYQIESPVSV